MQAYSTDLRAGAFAGYTTGRLTIARVARRFAVSVSFVDKLLKRQRTSGAGAALPRRGGPASCLSETDRQRSSACVAARPDAPLEELGRPVVAAGGPAVGRTVGWQTLQQVG